MDNRLIDNFNATISIWLTALDHYHFEELTEKPSTESWSLGQVYMHLVTETNFFITQINCCLSTNDNAEATLSPQGAALLQANDLPDEKIEGPPSNAFVVQPTGKQDLVMALSNVKASMNAAAAAMQPGNKNGKTKHPGFNYLSAREWMQFAEIHLRHHLRQKKRLDDFLAGRNQSE